MKTPTLLLALLLCAAATIPPASAPAARATQQLSLNGPWQIAFDDHNDGKRAQWQFDANLRKQQLQPVTIPSSWENLRANYEGVAWYRKQFDAPADWQGKSIRLRFDAVSYLAEVWLNGELVGYHEGGYDPFEFPVDNLLHYGKTNTLILRVISPIVLDAALAVDGMTKWEAPHWRGALIAGPWQDVSLTVTERTYVQDLFVESALDGSTKLNITINNAGVKNREATIHYTIRERNATATVWEHTETRLLEPGENTFTIPAAIPTPKLWSPDAPNLYEATITIDNNTNDAHTTRFGVREFTLAKDGFLLNGKKFYMKAGFWEGLYPVGLAVPDSPEMLRREITLAKAAHFNTLRPWRKPPAPWLIDMADELGILLIGAPALECMNEKPAIAGQMNRRVFHEIESMIRRDRNHPSIIIWELFNEVKRDAIARLKHESALRARALDPTRLIIDESGGWADGCKAYLPRSREYTPINEMHTYEKAPFRESIYTKYLTLANGAQLDVGWSKLTPGAVSIVSEVGYGSLPDLEANMRAFREKGNPLAPTYTSHEKLYTSMKKVMDEASLNEIFGDLSRMSLASQQVQSDGNKQMLEALRLNPHLNGYCIHAYTDGDWVIGAGVLDIWRNPKLQYEMLKTINAPLYISARIEPANIYAGAEANIKSRLVSETDNTQKGAVTLTLTTENGKPIWTKTLPVEARCGITPVLDEKLTIPADITGECVLTAVFAVNPPGDENVVNPPGDENAANLLGDEEKNPNGVPSSSPGLPESARATLGFDKQESPTPTGLCPLARNTFAIHIFPPVQKGDIAPAKKLVVLETNNHKLKSWLDQRGVPCAATLPANTANEDLLIITTVENPPQKDLPLWRDIFERVRQGATLVMLNPPLKQSKYVPANPAKEDGATTTNLLYTRNIFPLDLVGRTAKGHWVSNNHAIAPHPYFDGLPSRCFMGQLYANIAPLKTILGLARQKPIVSSVTWKIDRSYLGIEGAWWGSDLTRVPHGKGTIVLSTLSIVPNLDADPVADILMKNLINNTK